MEIGIMMKKMDKELINLVMEINIQDNLLKVLNKEEEVINIKLEIDMKGNGIMIKEMDLEK